MKKTLITLAIIAHLCTVPALAQQHQHMHTAPKCACKETQNTPTLHHFDNLRISKAYVKEAITTDQPSVAYMNIENIGDSADTLLSVKADISGSAEIHNMTVNEQGVMSMNSVTQGVEIPPHSTAEFKPHGLHIMLHQLSRPLRTQDSVLLTTVFAKAGTHTLAVPVGSNCQCDGHNKEHDTKH